MRNDLSEVVIGELITRSSHHSVIGSIWNQIQATTRVWMQYRATFTIDDTEISSARFKIKVRNKQEIAPNCLGNPATFCRVVVWQ